MGVELDFFFEEMINAFCMTGKADFLPWAGVLVLTETRALGIAAKFSLSSFFAETGVLGDLTICRELQGNSGVYYMNPCGRRDGKLDG